MPEFLPKSQVQVSGIGTPRVSELANDLSSLFGTVTKGAEKFAQVGEQAAKLEFQSKAIELQNQITDIKRAINADPYNTEFIREAGNAVERLTAEVLVNGDKFKNNEKAFSAYTSLATDYAASVRSTMLPMVESKLFEATQWNVKNSTSMVAETLGANALAENIRIEIDANNLAKTGLDVPTTFIKQNHATFNSDFNANPAFLVKSFYIDKKTGTLNIRKGDEALVNAYFSAFGKVNKDGILEKANDFVTDEHLEVVSSAIAKSHSLFKEPEGKQRSSQLAVALNNAESLVSKLENGTIDIDTAKTSITNVNDNITTYYDLGSETQKSAADDMKLKLEPAQLKFNFANDQLTRAIASGGKSIGTLLTNGYKGFSYTSNGVTNTEDIPNTVFVNMAKTEIANIEKRLYNQDGSVNMDTLSNLIQITNQTGTAAPSPLLQNILTGVFGSGSLNKQDVKGFLNDLTIARYALKYRTQPYQNINAEFVNSKYLDSLETTLKAKQTSKSPGDDIAAAKTVAAAGARGVQDWRQVATAFSNSAYSKFASDPSILNRIMETGSADWYSLNQQNTKTLTNRNVKYSGYQTTDKTAFLDDFADVVSSQANSYKFKNLALPNSITRFIPIAYDDQHKPISKEVFATAIGTELTKRGLALDTVKSLAGISTYKDKKTKGTFYMANLTKDTIEADVIDTDKGSLVRVKLYGEGRTKASNPLHTIDIRPDQFKQYNFEMDLIDAAANWLGIK